MKFVGNPTRILMPYDEALEQALAGARLLHHGVPARLLGPFTVEA